MKGKHNQNIACRRPDPERPRQPAVERDPRKSTEYHQKFHLSAIDIPGLDPSQPGPADQGGRLREYELGIARQARRPRHDAEQAAR